MSLESYTRSGLVIPGPSQADYHKLSLEIDETYKQLPTEGTEFRYDPLSETTCLAPPPGKAFEMTGAFRVVNDADSIEYSYAPSRPSFEMELEDAKKHPDYARLEQIEDDPVKIVAYLFGYDKYQQQNCEEYDFKDFKHNYKPIIKFVGDRLRVTGSVKRQADPEVNVLLLGQPTMRSDSGLALIGLPIAPGEFEMYFADIKTHLHWMREMASGKLGKMTVQLVDRPKEFDELTFPKDISRVKWNKLWEPPKTTSQEYSEFVWGGFSMTPEQFEVARVHEMRKHREMNHPFSDDPAKYLKRGSMKLLDYYTGRSPIRQIIRPRSYYEYNDRIDRETLVEALSRYISREVVHDDVRRDLQGPFDDNGRFVGEPEPDYFFDNKQRAEEHLKNTRQYCVGGTFFNL